MIEKRKPYRNKKLLQAAEGQECLANFPGCKGGHENDVAARHFNAGWAGKGTAQKADDCAIFYGCQHCENLYSGLLTNTNDYAIFVADQDYYLLRAYYNTVRRWLDLGTIK